LIIIITFQTIPKGILEFIASNKSHTKNIYPNIDVVFTIPSDSLKLLNTIFCASKGKISDIQLKFNGATTELIDNKIRMSVRFGEMENLTSELDRRKNR
jgi:hypothetical protein